MVTMIAHFLPSFEDILVERGDGKLKKKERKKKESKGSADNVIPNVLKVLMHIPNSLLWYKG